MLIIEAFTHWQEGEPFNGFLMATCPRCIRPHRIHRTGDGLTIRHPCRGLLAEDYIIAVSEDVMSDVRRPLRASDDPTDFLTPWITVKPESDIPDF